MTIGILDTNIIINGIPDREALRPFGITGTAITAVTMTELAAGPVAADTVERELRLAREVKDLKEKFPNPIPFDSSCEDAYVWVFTANKAAGRDHRRRFADLLIASIAVRYRLPLLTTNLKDFTPFQEAGLLTVIEA